MNVLWILTFIFVAVYSCVSWYVSYDLTELFCIYLLLLSCLLFILFWCVYRLLPTVLAWLFKRKYHIKLKIGRIAVPKLMLKDVSLSKDGYSIVSIIRVFKILKNILFNYFINMSLTPIDGCSVNWRIILMAKLM